MLVVLRLHTGGCVASCRPNGRKKIPSVSFPDTQTVKPGAENGIKLEAFIFDVFPLCHKMALFEVDRRGRRQAGSHGRRLLHAHAAPLPPSAVQPLTLLVHASSWSSSDEFAPVKDAPGGTGDTPEKACGMLSDEAKRWVQAAGGRLVLPEGGGDGVVCEISPLVSYKGEGLEHRVQGKDVTAPFSFLA